MTRDNRRHYQHAGQLPDDNQGASKTARKWLGILWVGSLLVAHVCPSAFADQGQVLEGSWVVTSATRNGELLTDMAVVYMTFAGKELTLKEQDGIELTIPFEMDSTSKPKTIDFKHTSSGWLPINLDFRGIYEWERDKLKLCLGEGERPTKFSDRDAIVVVLERKKPPLMAVVVESEGLLLPPDIAATYVVQVTTKHPDFEKGENVQIHLKPDIEVVRGKDQVAAKPSGWAKGTRLLLDRYDGIQKSKPPQIYPKRIVLED